MVNHSARPRWLVLTQYYAPEIGAPQLRLRSMVRELQRRGIDVEVLTAMPNYPAGKTFAGYEGRWRLRETIDGVPVRRVWVYAGTGKSARVRLANYFSFTATALVAAMTGRRPDVMFVESQPLSLGVVALCMKWLRGVPYIYNVPDLQVDVARQLGFMRNERLLRLAAWLEDRFLKHAWKISTVTHRFIDHFVGRGRARSQLTFLPNGADTAFLRPEPPSQALVERWNLAGKKTFLYVGTHAFYHGLDTLVEAATLLRHRTDLQFLFVGDGPERGRLADMAAGRSLQNVRFVGSSPYEEMCDLYSTAYASVATLRNMKVAEGMRLSKMFPSLSCGVPVIFAGAGEGSELLLRERCGLVVAPESPRLLADAIEQLAADQTLRDSLGACGRAWVEKECGWSTIVERWLQEIGFSDAQPGAPAPQMVSQASLR